MQPKFLDRVDSFADRVLDVVDKIADCCRSGRIVDQMSGAGTSVGANVYEADEALSRPDFCKCLGIALKELNETHYWLRLVARRKWVGPGTLDDLLGEATEIRRVMGSMIARTRTNSRAPS
ncbi:MAG: four helix bundle protein [Phycisphaerales bacterium]